jgi:hypothetical protein
VIVRLYDKKVRRRVVRSADGGFEVKKAESNRISARKNTKEFTAKPAAKKVSAKKPAAKKAVVPKAKPAGKMP